MVNGITFLLVLALGYIWLVDYKHLGFIALIMIAALLVAFVGVKRWG